MKLMPNQARELEGRVSNPPPLPSDVPRCSHRLQCRRKGKDSPQKPPHHKAFPPKLLKSLILFLALGVVFMLVTMHTTWLLGVKSLISTEQLGSQSCIDELRSWIKPLASVMHGMTDKELLWRASFVPQVNKYPFKRVPKIAFMFLTKGPLPLHPLWERFLRGHERLYSIYVHSLPSYQVEFPLESPFHGRHVPSQVSEWGRISMCDAERRLLANALLDISNEWFVLLSEACIPLFNFGIVYLYLIRSRYSYVGSFDEPGPYGRGRYDLNMTPEVEITQWRKGSQWFGVSRKVGLTIIKDIKYYPKFKEFCKPPCYADEHYFPTMLAIEVPHLLANRSITWVDWSRGGSHPATFGKANVTEAFLRRIVRWRNCPYNSKSSSICFLFARKFAPSALQPLLHLAPKVLGFC